VKNRAIVLRQILKSLHTPSHLTIMSSAQSSSLTTSHADTDLEVSFDDNDTILKGWPPAKVGTLPRSFFPEMTFKTLDPQAKIDRTCLLRGAEFLDKPQTNYLLRAWSAKLVNVQDASYLELPTHDIYGGPMTWSGFNYSAYPSNRLLIRKSYVTAASHLFRFAKKSLSQKGKRGYNPMLVAGSSGIGKTYFAAYFVWRLFHPDGVHLKHVPDTIVWRPRPNNKEGFIYHKGSFFSRDVLDTWWGTPDARSLLDHEDAWVIVDGIFNVAKECNTVVVTSPGNLKTAKDLGGSNFQKTTSSHVYLGPWTYEETIQVARDVHKFKLDGECDTLARFRKYGGIPRYVLQYHAESRSPEISDPVEEGIAWSNVLVALIEAGTKALDHSKVAGAIMHIFPNETLTGYNYQWGSHHIMESAFNALFQFEKIKVTCLVKGAAALNVGTFYGLLFEQYFHRQIGAMGYEGKFRQLLSPGDTQAASTKKRGMYGKTIEKLVASKHRIPKLPINNFAVDGDIKSSMYNIPDIPNFPVIDSLCPQRKEMYQITSNDSHVIKGDHLSRIKEHFKLLPGEKVKLIFVVPPHRFREFTIQKIVDAKKQEMRVDWIDQFVMEMDATPLINRFEASVGSYMKKAKTGGS
jgi:hypothetical protein